MPIKERLFPTRIKTIRSNLKGAIPKQYDPAWQTYTDLSPEQIAAFQAFPEWAVKLADHNALLASKGLSSDFSVTRVAPAIKG